MKKICILIFAFLLFSFEGKQVDPRTINFPKKVDYMEKPPREKNFWIFILAGQSNMAGRGFIEPEDTIPSPGIYTINKENKWIIAKEPLHFYEPSMTGLDCGLSFGKELSANLNDTTIYIGLIPCAVGGSSVEQWLSDSTFRGVKLFSNIRNKIEFASKVGTIKGILWHQGESDANRGNYKNYEKNLQELFIKFRKTAHNDSLPILVGELGPFLNKETFDSYPDSINHTLKQISESVKNVVLIKTGDLNHKGDTLHFDSKSLRILGKRYADSIKIK